MLGSTLILLMSGAVFMLRLGANGNSFPKPLSADEEQKYVEKWMEGDIDARNILIEHNLRLVAHVIKKYYTQAEDADDLISIGTIGLIKGINTYRPDKGVRLATYASKCAENEILMHFRSRKKSQTDLSLSDSIDLDGDGNSLSLMDVIAEEDDMAEVLGHKETCEILKVKVKEVLTEREAEIIRLRYGLDGGEGITQRETAKMLGISRSYVSRLEKKALEKLKLVLAD